MTGATTDDEVPGGAAVRWVWLFLDTPVADAERSWAFWSEVTGQEVVDRRGERDEFATLAPPQGDPWLKLQAVGSGRGGVHLDLDVEDVHLAAARAEALGATRVGAIGDTVVVLRSPDAHIAAHLSGKAQFVGYLLAAIGPLIVGLIRGWTGSFGWCAILFVLLGLGAAVNGWFAGRALSVNAKTIETAL